MQQLGFFNRNQNFIGDRAKLARVANGMALKDVGAEINSSPQFVHKIEKGYEPTEELLRDLSELYNVAIDFFYSPRRFIVDDEDCHFRSQTTSKKSVKNQIMAKVEAFFPLQIALNEYLDLMPTRIPDGLNWDLRSQNSIEMAAEKFRRDMNMGLGPIDNMIKFAEYLGVLVLNMRIQDIKIDAFSIDKSLDQAIIVRNQDDKKGGLSKESACRARFDIAHEIGHLYLHQGVDTGCRETERQANQFASALLMPRLSFAQEFPKTSGMYLNWDKLLLLKRRWKVSLKAILYRARTLGLITEKQATTGFRQLVSRGFSKVEPLDDQMQMESPSILDQAFNGLETVELVNVVQSSMLSPQAIKQWYGIELSIKSVSETSPPRLVVV